MNEPNRNTMRDTAAIVLMAVAVTFGCAGGLLLIVRPGQVQVVAQPPLSPAASEYSQRDAEVEPIPSAVPPSQRPRPPVGEYEYQLDGQFNGQVTALATTPPLVENGYEVVGGTARKPDNPHPGQRYLDTDLNTYSIYNGTSWVAVNTSAGIGVIDDIGDVDIDDAATGDFLGWNGTTWADIAVYLDTLNDVTITTPAVKHTLRHNGTTWVNSTLAATDLSDINFTSLADNDLPVYDSATSKWLNESVYENQRIFSVTDYGAIPDDVTDDTTGIQAAIDAAEVYTAANATATAEVALPRGLYILNGDAGISGKCVSLDGDRITIRGPGTLKLADADDAGCVLQVAGDYNTIRDLTVDGNAAGVPTGRNECLRVTGNFNIIDTVTCQNTSTTPTTGNTFLVSEDAVNTRLINCTSLESGENALRVDGDYTSIINFYAYGFDNKGFTSNNTGGDLDMLSIQGYYAESNTTRAAANGLQVDLMGGGTGQGRSIRNVSIKDAVIRMTAASGPTVATKFAKIGRLELDNVRVEHPALDMASIKLAEGIGSIHLHNCVLESSINQDPSSQGTNDSYGVIASVADNGSGKCRFTITGGTTVKRGDWVYIITNSVGDTEYDGLHEITDDSHGDGEDGLTFDTSRDFTDTATGAYYTCTASMALDDCTIGLRTHNPQACLDDLRASQLSVRRCNLVGFSARGIELQDPDDAEQFPVDCVTSIKVEDTLFESNSSSANYAIRVNDNSIDWGSSSRKVYWRNNKLTNAGSQDMDLARRSDLLILFSANGGPQDYYADTIPTGAADATNSAVTWQVGDRFWRTAAASGEFPGWICTTSGTFSTGAFKRMTPAGLLAVNTTEVGNVGTGVDDLMTYTLPANTILNAGESLEIEAGFTFAANGNNKQIALLIGGSEYYTTGAVAQNSGSMVLKMTVAYDTSLLSKFSTMVQTTGSAAIPNVASVNGGVFNPTTSNIIKCTGEATSNNDIVMEFLKVKLVPGP